jgi:hypothetical protein
MEEQHCKFANVVGLMQEDIREIRKDVRSLLKYKWQSIGAGMVIAAISGTCLTVLITMMK